MFINQPMQKIDSWSGHVFRIVVAQFLLFWFQVPSLKFDETGALDACISLFVSLPALSWSRGLLLAGFSFLSSHLRHAASLNLLRSNTPLPCLVPLSVIIATFFHPRAGLLPRAAEKSGFQR